MKTNFQFGRGDSSGSLIRVARTESASKWSRSFALSERLILSAFLLASATGPAMGARATFQSDPEYLIDAWEKEDGLPENSATAMAQTPDGYLWFGTFDGLVRFDGVKFTVFNPRNTPGLRSGSIVNLHLDRRDVLWASTYEGIARYDGREWRALGKQEGWSGDYARTFAERRDGALLITTFNGQLFEVSNDRFTRVLDPPGERGEGYFGHVDEYGQWWVAQHAFVGRLEKGRLISGISVSNVMADAVGSVPARDGSTWLLLGRELRKLRNGIESSRVLLPERPGGIWSMAEDSQTNVWIATLDQGICRVTPAGEMRRWSTTNGLSSHSTRFVFEDREENLWVGTSGGGLIRFKPRRARTIGPESGLLERIVQSVAPDASGGVWIATYGQGLFRWRDNALTRFAGADGKNTGGYVQSVYEDRAGRLWTGLYGEGARVFDSHGARPATPGWNGGDNVISIFEDSRGRIWMGDGQGVTVCESNQFRVLATEHGLPNGGVGCFAEDSHGVLWLSNRRNVYCWDGNRFVEQLDPDGKSLRDITCLKADANGAMWLGSSDDGLLRWRPEKLTRIDRAAGFPAASVQGIVEDDRGFFWIASNLGVVRASRAGLEAVANGTASRLTCQVVDVSDGLTSRECTSGHQPVCARDARGRLWFATLKGAAVIDPATFHVNTSVPDVHIEQVVYRSPAKSSAGLEPGQSRASDEIETRLTAPFPEPLILPPGSRRLEIHYTATSYRAPEKVRFQTTLATAGDDWRDVEGERIARLDEHPPDDYVFRVRAANDDGIWNESGARLAFTVLPYFWQTIWFRAACGSGLLASGAAIMWLSIRSKLRLATEREQAARSLIEIQERMDLAADAAQLGSWGWDVSSNSVWATEKFREMLGFSPAESITYEGFLARVCERDRDAVHSAVQQTLRERVRLDIECRVMLPNGITRWIAATGRAKFTSANVPSQLLGVAIDITERHRAEEESREVSSKLITAQEDERKRIARDLHDDLNQRLALLSIEMELFGAASKDTSGSARERLESMTSQLKELSSEVHRLSYQLHPAKLDQLGLVVAARTYCREVSLQAGITVHFEQHDVPRDVNVEVALCLYRVIQEAVQNSVRHNGGTAVQVSLTHAAEQIRLLVTDEGKGFDVEHAIHNGGLGLVSMRERVRQVHGSIQFTSSPGKGARIEVNVPFLHRAPAM